MPKTRKSKRKQPVTVQSTSVGSSNSSATRSVIRRFHVLLKRQAQLQRLSTNAAGSLDRDPVENELASIDEEMTRMGGLAAYQRMSTIGQGKDRGGGSEKVLIEWLRELHVPENLSKANAKMKLLEVGALRPDNYGSCSSWIDHTPIDLHSQYPAIQEQDFLLMPEDQNRSKWDIISLSLVLNFVPDPKDRGRMLRLAHTILHPSGYLFVALPLPCVLNSRYLTPELFHELMVLLSFKQLTSRWKDGGKMAYWLFQKSDTTPQSSIDAKFTKKTVLRQGNRNNFTILL